MYFVGSQINDKLLLLLPATISLNKFLIVSPSASVNTSLPEGAFDSSSSSLGVQMSDYKQKQNCCYKILKDSDIVKV